MSFNFFDLQNVVKVSSLNLYLTYTMYLALSEFCHTKSKTVCALGVHWRGILILIWFVFLSMKALLNATNTVCLHIHTLSHLLARSFTQRLLCAKKRSHVQHTSCAPHSSGRGLGVGAVLRALCTQTSVGTPEVVQTGGSARFWFRLGNKTMVPAFWSLPVFSLRKES